MDIAEDVCDNPQISIWPRQDGYNYPFQTDHILEKMKERERLRGY